MLRLELAVAQRSVIGSPEAHRTEEGPADTVTNPDTVRTVFIDWPDQSPWIHYSVFIFISTPCPPAGNKLFIFIFILFYSASSHLILCASPVWCSLLSGA
jgi:hypothetical protein